MYYGKRLFYNELLVCQLVKIQLIFEKLFKYELHLNAPLWEYRKTGLSQNVYNLCKCSVTDVLLGLYYQQYQLIQLNSASCLQMIWRLYVPVPCWKYRVIESLMEYGSTFENATYFRQVFPCNPTDHWHDPVINTWLYLGVYCTDYIRCHRVKFHFSFP